jgi:hypothetical protein
MKRDSRRGGCAGVVLPALLLMLLVSGCAQTHYYYTEPELRSDEAGILEATVPVWIVSLDGQRVSYGATGDTRTLRISPGPHVIEVSYAGLETQAGTNVNEQIYIPGERTPYTRWMHVHSSSNAQVKLTAKPGHTYSITAERSGNRWRPSIANFLTMNPSASPK